MKKTIQISSVSFVVLYIMAAIFYPVFFNPSKLFFCDLMETSIGFEESINYGRPFAIASLISVATVIASFFIWFANQSKWSKLKKNFTKISGSLSAFLTAFIFTELHDQLLLLASVIGFFPLTIVAIEMLKTKPKRIPILGLISFLLLAVYNIVFYLNIYELFWPIMQKICIVICLIWINLEAVKAQTSRFTF